MSTNLTYDQGYLGTAETPLPPDAIGPSYEAGDIVDDDGNPLPSIYGNVRPPAAA